MSQLSLHLNKVIKLPKAETYLDQAKTNKLNSFWNHIYSTL